MSDQIHFYSELQQRIHEDLRIQHPEWVEPNGGCPTCDSYESRLAELIGLDQRSTAYSTAQIISDGLCRRPLKDRQGR